MKLDILKYQMNKMNKKVKKMKKIKKYETIVIRKNGLSIILYNSTIQITKHAMFIELRNSNGFVYIDVDLIEYIQINGKDIYQNFLK